MPCTNHGRNGKIAGTGPTAPIGQTEQMELMSRNSLRNQECLRDRVGPNREPLPLMQTHCFVRMELNVPSSLNLRSQPLLAHARNFMSPRKNPSGLRISGKIRKRTTRRLREKARVKANSGSDPGGLLPPGAVVPMAVATRWSRAPAWQF